MTKIIKKSKCKFEHGLIVKKNKVIGVPTVVALQLMKLETVYQQWDYLRKQPAYQPGPSLNGFERKSIFDTELPYVDMPDTPVTDARIEEAMAFMEECDKVEETGKVNEQIDEYKALIDWCSGDTFVEGNYEQALDTPCLGNPLELEPHTIVSILMAVVSNPIVMEE